MLSWLASILSSPATPTDCLRAAAFDDFCTLNGAPGVDLVGLVGNDEPFDSGSFLIASGGAGWEEDEGPQRQVCFLGMAAVTAAQEHGREAG